MSQPQALRAAFPGSTPDRRPRILLLVGLAALINLGGAAFLNLYFSVEAAPSLAKFRLVSRSEIFLLSLLPGLLTPVMLWLYTRPLGVVPRAAEERLQQLRRRSLRVPLVSALFSLAAWFLVALLIAGWVWMTFKPAPEAPAAGNALAEGFFQAGNAFRQTWMALAQAAKALGLVALLSGMVSAVLFFMTESAWGRELPQFFPGGRLSAAGLSWIIPVRWRLVAIFVLVGSAPLILLGALSYQRAIELQSAALDDGLSGLLLFNLFMVLAGIGLAVLLAGFVARSVSAPLERQRRAMARLKAGDLSVRLPVRSNDELGLVAEGFNDMAEALGEKDAAIRELTSGLEAKVAERTAALTAALAEKERTQAALVHAEKMASLGQLVAGVAHKINNPVGYIYANADHLERGLARARDAAGQGDSAGLADALSRMEKIVASTREGARRAKEIVQGLKTFSYRDPSVRRALDLREPIETAIMLMSHELKRGIELEKSYEDAPVLGNPGELSQVFTNVLMNAVQAMGERGHIRIVTRREPGRMIAEIRDDGPGIKPEHLPRLFEPFFTTKEVGKGTGLGLSIAYGIVRAHGGEIRAESEPGRGTAIIVALPPPPELKPDASRV